MRHRTLVVWSSLTLFGLFSSTAATAQSRDNLWLSIGWGVGSASGSSHQLDDGTRARGKGWSLGLGWALNEQFLIGGEVHNWFRRGDVDAANLDIDIWSGTITFYPSPSSGFFVKGGMGVSTLFAWKGCGEDTVQLAGFPPLTGVREPWEDTFIGCDGDHTLGKGVGLIAGVGYDIPLARWVALTSAVNVWYGHPGALEFGEQKLVDGWHQNAVDVTIGITFR